MFAPTTDTRNSTNGGCIGGFECHSAGFGGNRAITELAGGIGTPTREDVGCRDGSGMIAGALAENCDIGESGGYCDQAGGS